jgi:hypothetical protein
MPGTELGSKPQDSREFLRNVLGEEIKTLRAVNRGRQKDGGDDGAGSEQQAREQRPRDTDEDV